MEEQKHGKNSTNDADFVTLNADEASLQSISNLWKYQYEVANNYDYCDTREFFLEFQQGFPNISSQDFSGIITKKKSAPPPSFPPLIT